jgi:hypothetical protein
MVPMRPDDTVAFTGPSSAVQKWPAPGERGVIQRIDRGVAHVVWERSSLVVAWPTEWIERRDEPVR